MVTTRSASHDTPAWQLWHDPDGEIRVGISSCLLGQKVRYDGGHKHDRYLTDTLGAWVTWVPVCPEVGIGLGIPDPPSASSGARTDPGWSTPAAGRTSPPRWTRTPGRRCQTCSASTSTATCSRRTRRHVAWSGSRSGVPGGCRRKDGVGVYARVLQELWPLLPLEEEGRLNDPVLRETFIERLFARNRWRALVRRGLDRGRLVEFHTAHKLVLRSHNEAGYQRLGRLVASAGQLPDAELFQQYERELHETMTSRATPKRHANVLYHIAGYLKTRAVARGEAGARRPDRGLPPGTGPAGGPGDAPAPPRPPPRGDVHARPALPGAPPQGADAAKPGVSQLSAVSCQLSALSSPGHPSQHMKRGGWRSGKRNADS